MTVARQIAFSDLEFGNVIAESATPTSFGSPSAITTAFTGDLTKVSHAVGKSVTGSTTLEQPSSGYTFRTENSINFVFLDNQSGFNNSTSSNSGRTGVAAYYTRATNSGNGDAYCYYANATVSGAKIGATSFLANPAAVLFAGSATAGAAGVYLNPVEIDLSDGGFDAAGINFVANSTRSVDTGAIGCVWFGYRSQSQGAKPIDAHFSASGGSKIAIDLTGYTSNSSGTWTKAAMTLLGGDRIYLNASAGATNPGFASATGNSYIYYDTGNTGLEAVVGGSPVFLFTSSSAFIYGSTITLAQNSNNKVTVAGAATGSAPAIAITGSSDTNQDLKISALGTGQIQFNNAGSFSANGSVATSLGSVGPVGSHTTVQKWLTIKDNGAVVGYIPVF